MSKFKVGDRCVLLPCPSNAVDKNYDGPEPGDIVFLRRRANLYNGWVVDDNDNAVSEDCLRKIDDDHDQIPADIRAIFDDKCDETLPRPERITHD